MQLRTLAVVAGLAACGDNFEGNRPPIIEPFEFSTQEDLEVTKTVVVADLDVGNVPTIEVPVAPPHGTVEINGLSLTYKPAPHFHGNDRFELIATDGVDTSSFTVDVSVDSINDEPFGSADSIATNEDVARTISVDSLLMNDLDVDGDRLSFVSVGSPTNGTVTFNAGTRNITFTPTPNFNGTASFVYMVTDGTFTVPVTVQVVVGGTNDAPVANDDTGTTTVDTPFVVSETTLLANDTDIDGQVLSISTVTNGTNGTVSFDGTDVTFTPDAAFTGTATFQYTATDGVALDTAIVTVTVN